ncbi:putative holin-like toxin [Scopulibacillus darangshiensis]
MSVFEVLTLMIAFGSLVALMQSNKRK